MSTLFPELNRKIVEHILRNGVRIREEALPYTEVLEHLRDVRILTSEEHTYVRCAYQGDYDYLDRPDLNCDGRIEISSGDEECPACGMPIGDVEQKSRFVEHEIRLNPAGIEQYLEKALSALDVVQSVEAVGPHAYRVELQNGCFLNVVVPEYTEIRHLSAGLFFDEPTLYIIASAINEPTTTVIEERQYMLLADLLSSPMDMIMEALQIAAIPFDSRRELAELEERFDQWFRTH